MTHSAATRWINNTSDQQVQAVWEQQVVKEWWGGSQERLSEPRRWPLSHDYCHLAKFSRESRTSGSAYTHTHTHTHTHTSFSPQGNPKLGKQKLSTDWTESMWEGGWKQWFTVWCLKRLFFFFLRNCRSCVTHFRCKLFWSTSGSFTIAAYSSLMTRVSSIAL